LLVPVPLRRRPFRFPLPEGRRIGEFAGEASRTTQREPNAAFSPVGKYWTASTLLVGQGVDSGQENSPMRVLLSLILATVTILPATAGEKHDWSITGIEVGDYVSAIKKTEVILTCAVRWDSTDDEDEVTFTLMGSRNGRSYARFEITRRMRTILECSGECRVPSCGEQVCSVALESTTIDGSCYQDTSSGCAYDMKRGWQHPCSGCATVAFDVIFHLEVERGDTLDGHVTGEHDKDSANDFLSVEVR
jgi:hypothetical protein